MSAEDSLTVPVLLLDGSLRHPFISPETTAQDLIESLVKLDVVSSTAVDGIPLSSWALQRVRREKTGRKWEEADLEALGDGIISSTARIAPLLAKLDTSTSQERYSVNPSSSHRPPVLRLIARHPLLSLTFSFLRVPEIHDDFKWTIFFGKCSTVDDIVRGVVEELGLVKKLPTSKRRSC
ncbi:hypothetical protein F5I97DRAFT_822608 [Phlebopus sp. FC_14]|nr:hypothetical protein F5I97DRAFT_822608 [Phlebopus sp. FC_14]